MSTLSYGHRSEPTLELLHPSSGTRGMGFSSGTHTESRDSAGIQDKALFAYTPSSLLPFIHRCLLSTHYVPGTEDSAWKKTKSLSSWSLHSNTGSQRINRK